MNCFGEEQMGVVDAMKAWLERTVMLLPTPASATAVTYIPVPHFAVGCHGGGLGEGIRIAMSLYSCRKSTMILV